MIYVDVIENRTVIPKPFSRQDARRTVSSGSKESRRRRRVKSSGPPLLPVPRRSAYELQSRSRPLESLY